MAKARARPPAAERFIGLPRGAAVAPAPAGFGDDDLPDLAEADVWYSGHHQPDLSSQQPPGPAPAAGGPRAEGKRAPRRGVGGLSRAFGGDGGGARQVAASAPVEVPAWPSRFAADPEPDPALLFEMEMQAEAYDDGKNGGGADWEPPHLFLARRQARASVVEGAGRTLKGRDMSRVRDAVWSRTGFDG